MNSRALERCHKEKAMKYSVEQLEKFQDSFEHMRRTFHRNGDHDGQRLAEFALEMIRRYQNEEIAT
jgi:hypothetical protein